MSEQVCNTVMISREQFDRLNNRHMRADDLREMLRAMQAGEMTVSRGVELLDMWLAGNYTDEQLPPVRDMGFGEDDMPCDFIESLRGQVADLTRARSELSDNIIALDAVYRKAQTQLATMAHQRDELLAAAQAVIERWDTPLWKDVPATAEYINALRSAVAKAKP